MDDFIYHPSQIKRYAGGQIYLYPCISYLYIPWNSLWNHHYWLPSTLSCIKLTPMRTQVSLSITANQKLWIMTYRPIAKPVRVERRRTWHGWNLESKTFEGFPIYLELLSPLSKSFLCIWTTKFQMRTRGSLRKSPESFGIPALLQLGTWRSFIFSLLQTTSPSANQVES